MDLGFQKFKASGFRLEEPKFVQNPDFNLQEEKNPEMAPTNTVKEWAERVDKVLGIAQSVQAGYNQIRTTLTSSEPTNLVEERARTPSPNRQYIKRWPRLTIAEFQAKSIKAFQDVIEEKPGLPEYYKKHSVAIRLNAGYLANFCRARDMLELGDEDQMELPNLDQAILEIQVVNPEGWEKLYKEDIVDILKENLPFEQGVQTSSAIVNPRDYILDPPAMELVLKQYNEKELKAASTSTPQQGELAAIEATTDEPAEEEFWMQVIAPDVFAETTSCKDEDDENCQNDNLIKPNSALPEPLENRQIPTSNDPCNESPHGCISRGTIYKKMWELFEKTKVDQFEDDTGTIFGSKTRFELVDTLTDPDTILQQVGPEGQYQLQLMLQTSELLQSRANRIQTDKFVIEAHNHRWIDIGIAVLVLINLLWRITAWIVDQVSYKIEVYKENRDNKKQSKTTRALLQANQALNQQQAESWAEPGAPHY